MENEVKYSEEIEKVLNAENESCPLLHSEACEYFNPKGCPECPVANLKPEKQAKALAALDRLRAAAPLEKLQPLYAGDKCRFCKGEPEKADGVALFDLAKPDPEGNWTVALGKRSLTMKGADMMLPLQVSCCKSCRKKYMLYDYLPTAVGLGIAAAGFVVSTLKPVYRAAFEKAAWLPLAMMGGFLALAVAVGLLIKAGLRRSLKSKMHTDVSEIPEIKELMDNGFYEVQEKKSGVSRLVFSKERRENGICSKMPAEPIVEPDEIPQVMGIWPAEAYIDDMREPGCGMEECSAPAPEAAPEAETEPAEAPAINEE
jgi:hypothetical protein